MHFEASWCVLSDDGHVFVLQFRLFLVFEFYSPHHFISIMKLGKALSE